MPTAEEMIAGKTEVREWYRKHLIKIHGNNCPALIQRVMDLTSYEETRELFANETGKHIGPYSPF